MARVQQGCCGGGGLTRPDLHDRAHARGSLTSAGKAAGNVAYRLCELRAEQLDGQRAAADGTPSSWSWVIEPDSLPHKRRAGAAASPASQGVRRGRRGRRLCRRDRMRCRTLWRLYRRLLW